MKVGKTRINLAVRLAKELTELTGQTYFVFPEDLKVNRGSNIYNDWCSWCGWAVSDKGERQAICSWVSMGELLKQKSIGILDKNRSEITWEFA